MLDKFYKKYIQLLISPIINLLKQSINQYHEIALCNQLHSKLQFHIQI
nr:MAG TPA: hypothetical protein [Bacteriophage sp.]